MESNLTHVCFEMPVPSEYEGLAVQRAIGENPVNASPFDAALLRSRYWNESRILRVRFLNGVPIVQNKVEKYAHQWEQETNMALTFDFGSDPDAEIRIAFEDVGGPSRSSVGTDALAILKNEPTMFLFGLKPDSSETTYSSIVLHEFGHVLGLIHEHQSSTVTIQWNEAWVIQYVMERSFPTWTRERVQAWAEHNIFRHYLPSELGASESGMEPTPFDPLSIMLYRIPPEWTRNDFATRVNTTLSETDKSFIRRIYPR